MLTINIMPVIRTRGIENPYTFLVKAGFTRHAANILLSNSTRSFRLDHIELVCRVLLCEPNDILFFTPGKESNLPPRHPLFKLQKTETPPNWKETLATKSYSELKEITSRIAKD